MTDDIDDLRKSLRAAPPASDPARRAEVLARAMESFDLHQETSASLRPMSDRPSGAGILTGVRRMLSTLTSRGALAATASVAALALGLVIVAPALQRAPMLPKAMPPVAKTEAPEETQTTPVAKTAAETVPETSVGIADDAPSQPETAPLPDLAAQSTVDAAGGEATDLALAEPMTEATGIAEGDAAVGRMELRRDRSQDAAAATDHAAPDQEYAAPAPGAFADSLVAAAPVDRLAQPEPNTEAFPEADSNPVKIVAEEPVSTFSTDVDTASYAVVRSSLMAGYLPPPDAVRVEEMVNYFPYAYPAPAAGEAPFRPTVSLAATPWNDGTRLLRIGIQGALPATDARPPLNLVFLIDTSGSMEDPNKLPLLKQSFRLMLGQLRAEDQVAIVTYAGSAGQVLAPTPASDQAAVMAALDNLAAGGSTAGQEGLQQAYSVAEGMAADGEVTRILLATDGDFNVGISDPAALTDYIARKRDTGTYLSVLGFGRGNLDDATMQALAQNGNGTAAYIDTLSEAQKVLVDQLTGALFPIADDVKVQVEFNPAVVAEYRLIGYETRALAREDFNNDKVDAGDIGAGLQVTALYEVTPVGSPAILSDPLRYQTATDAPERAPGTMELGFLKLRYKAPGDATSRLIELPIPTEPTAPDDDFRFAAAVAGMGQLLTEAKYLNDWGWDDAIALANAAKGTDDFGYRAEAVQLMRLAESLSGQ